MKSQRRFAPITGRFQPESVAVLPGIRIFTDGVMEKAA